MGMKRIGAAALRGAVGGLLAAFLASAAPAAAQDLSAVDGPLVGDGFVPARGAHGSAAAGAVVPTPDPGASGRVFHVDYESGDDGTEAAPNRGLTREAPRRTVPPPEMLGPGDRILFKGGVAYRETVHIRRSGTPEAPIVYDGNSRGEWGEGRAVLDGAEPVGPWTRAGETAGGLPVWQAPLDSLRGRGPDGLPVLFLGDRRLTIASSADAEDPWAPENMNRMFEAPREQVTETTIADPGRLGAFSDAWDAAWVRKHYGNNHFGSFRVTGYEPAAGVLSHAPAKMLRAGNVRYAVLNHPDVFDARGEIRLDPAGGRVLIIPYEGLDPNADGVRSAARQFGVHNKTFSHFAVRGFRFARHLDMSFSSGDWRSTTRHEGVVLENNLFAQSGGILLLRSDGARVRGNRVFEVIEGQPLFLRGAARALVENNSTRRARTGITVYSTTDSVFRGNDSRETLGQHGNALTVYEGSHDNLFAGNLIQAGRSGFALTLRQSSGLTFAFNVIAGNVNQWAQTEAGDKLDFFNNTFTGAVRIQPKTAARTRFVNNVIGHFGMPPDWQEAIGLRAYNAYAGFIDGEAGRARLREGEMQAPLGSLLTPDPDDPLILRPNAEGRRRLSQGASLNAGGMEWSHVGAFGPDGTLPDVTRLGQP